MNTLRTSARRRQAQRPGALAHKLPGVAATLALPQTARAACELDRLLHAGQDPYAQLAILHATLQRSAGAIHLLRKDFPQ